MLYFRRTSEITSQMRDQEEYRVKAVEAEQRIKVVFFKPALSLLTEFFSFK